MTDTCPERCLNLCTGPPAAVVMCITARQTRNGGNACLNAMFHSHGVIVSPHVPPPWVASQASPCSAFIPVTSAKDSSRRTIFAPVWNLCRTVRFARSSKRISPI